MKAPHQQNGDHESQASCAYAIGYSQHAIEFFLMSKSRPSSMKIDNILSISSPKIKVNGQSASGVLRWNNFSCTESHHDWFRR